MLFILCPLQQTKSATLKCTALNTQEHCFHFGELDILNIVKLQYN